MDFKMYAFLMLAVCVSSSLQKETVKLTLFYESYCPASIYFVEEQLLPAWKRFKDAIDLDLVPYGKASQTYRKGHWHFTCQHGEKECIGNILHSCNVRGLVKKRQYTKLVNLIGCFMNQTDQHQSAKKCCKQNGVNFKPVNKCQNGKQGENLEAAFGNRTKSFTPAITFVPTIVFNGVFKQADQDKAMEDLESVLCQYVPNHKHCS